MTNNSEAQFSAEYRRARKAFVAACKAAAVDSIARVHPTARAPDGKPLFLDCAALGPREATKALLLVAGVDGRDGRFGTDALVDMLGHGLAPLKGARLVLVHALNPFGFAWGRCENEDGIPLARDVAGESWSFKMLRAIQTEDLAQVNRLRVADIASGAGTAATLCTVLATHNPDTRIEIAPLAAATLAHVRDAAAALAAL